MLRNRDLNDSFSCFLRFFARAGSSGCPSAPDRLESPRNWSWLLLCWMTSISNARLRLNLLSISSWRLMLTVCLRPCSAPRMLSRWMRGVLRRMIYLVDRKRDRRGLKAQVQRWIPCVWTRNKVSQVQASSLREGQTARQPAQSPSNVDPFRGRGRG